MVDQTSPFIKAIPNKWRYHLAQEFTKNFIYLNSF